MDKSMKADEISTLAAKILVMLQEVEPDPYKRIAALRTAAHSIENMLTAGIIKQSIVSGLARLVNLSNQ